MFMSKANLARLAGVLAITLMPAAAYAHVGAGATSGLAHGFWHPIGGLDHVLAMVAVGLFAAQLGGRALWAVPLAFVSVMAVGGLVGIAGVEIPYVEIGIALSIVVLGLTLALRWQTSVAMAMALVGLFAVFHGHAHGAEMPENASSLAYAAGFVIATALLHLTGIAAALGLERLAGAYRDALMRSGGAMIAVAGMFIVFSAV